MRFRRDLVRDRSQSRGGLSRPRGGFRAAARAALASVARVWTPASSRRRARILFSIVALAVPAPGATEIADPEKFVSDVYRHFVAAQNSRKTYNAPQDIYTPRLAGLFEKDRRESKGEVGCIEFDFWMNGQDFELSNLKVTRQPVAGHPDQTTVIATFTNLRKPMELHFNFIQQRGKWMLDDVASTKGETWTLSKLLSCHP